MPLLAYEARQCGQTLTNSGLRAFPLCCLQVARIIRILKVLRLIKLLRLARIMRLPPILQRLEAVIGRVLLQLFTMAGSMILLLHWAACIWYYVAVVDEDGKSWVVHEDMQNASFDEIYITALYWSVTTIATVGYGEYPTLAADCLCSFAQARFFWSIVSLRGHTLSCCVVNTW